MEHAVTQLTNIGALDYFHGDFGLINKLVMKLPYYDQRHYADYVTSEDTVVDEKSSSWDSFWLWLKQRYSAALQARVMHMCVKSTTLFFFFIRTKFIRTPSLNLSPKLRTFYMLRWGKKANCS